MLRHASHDWRRHPDCVRHQGTHSAHESSVIPLCRLSECHVHRVDLGEVVRQHLPDTALLLRLWFDPVRLQTSKTSLAIIADRQPHMSLESLESLARSAWQWREQCTGTGEDDIGEDDENGEKRAPQHRVQHHRSFHRASTIPCLNARRSGNGWPNQLEEPTLLFLFPRGV